MRKIGAGDRLRVAWEYCQERINLPDDPQLEELLKWCRERNAEVLLPLTLERKEKLRKQIHKGFQRWKERHPERWREIRKKYENSEGRVKRRKERRNTLRYKLNERIRMGIYIGKT